MFTRIFIIAILSLVAVFDFPASAQRWKKMRYEMFAGTGMSDFLGELGGRNAIGSDYWYDLEFKAIRPAFNGGMRYRLTQSQNIQAMITYGWVSGDDKLTLEYFRHNRNLHFRSPVVELSAFWSISLTQEQVGRKYKLRRIKGTKWSRWIGINLYPWAGLAVFYFNPKARYDNSWTALQPLSTEGQGLVPTRRPYSRIQFAIPFGIGFKYAIDRQFSISLEYGLRKTFTDYIDDVSTTYFDNDALRAARGNRAADLADPSIGPPGNTAPGQQRGDPTDKDSYMFMNLSLNYKMVLRRARRSRPKF